LLAFGDGPDAFAVAGTRGASRATVSCNIEAFNDNVQKFCFGVRVRLARQEASATSSGKKPRAVLFSAFSVFTGTITNARNCLVFKSLLRQLPGSAPGVRHVTRRTELTPSAFQQRWRQIRRQKNHASAGRYGLCCSPS